jgi:hypothetical protein
MDNLFGSNPFLGKDNPYLQNVIDSTLGDVTRNYNLAVKPQTESAMVRSGSFGNSGLQQMQGEQQRQLAQTLGNTASNLRANDYNQQQQMYQWDQGFNKNIYDTTFGQNQQNLQSLLGLFNAGSGFNSQDINNATAVQNTPFNYFNQFSNVANGIGGQGGTASSTMTGTGSPLLGALGGYQLGGALGKNLGFGGWTNNPIG